MTAIDLLFFLSALGAGGIVALAVGRNAGPGKLGRWTTGLLCGLGLALTLCEAATVWLGQTGDPWNAARLTPAIALHHGFKLYYPLHSGPVLSTVVGPVAFLFYWPIGFLPVESPSLLILAACALNVAAFGALAAWTAGRIAPAGAPRWIAWLVGAQLALFYASLRYSLFSIHADAPALLLSGLGVTLLLAAQEPPGWRRCAGIALCLTLAVWAKQSMAPIFLAALLLAGLHDGWVAAGRLAAASFVSGLLVSVVLVGWLGFAELRDNMFLVPAHHPWVQMSLLTGETYPRLAAVGLTAHAKVMAAAGLNIVRANWPLFAILIFALLGSLAAGSRRRWPRTFWAGYLLTALLLFPTAAIGRAKVGGEINHESFVVFFLVAAVVAWLVETERPGAAGQPSRSAIVLALLLLLNAPRAFEYPGWRIVADNQNEAAFRYDRAHPGRVYFPWNPLSSLLAEHRLYHFDYGVFDRNLGGARVSPDHLREFLPSPDPVIASYIAHHDYILHTYFPDHVALPHDPALPEWHLYGPVAGPVTPK